nr:MAG: RNA-dependent RNA polymerase [brine shrimp endornavirus 1]
MPITLQRKNFSATNKERNRMKILFRSKNRQKRMKETNNYGSVVRVDPKDSTHAKSIKEVLRTKIIKAHPMQGWVGPSGKIKKITPKANKPLSMSRLKKNKTKISNLNKDEILVLTSLLENQRPGDKLDQNIVCNFDNIDATDIARLRWLHIQGKLDLDIPESWLPIKTPSPSSNSQNPNKPFFSSTKDDYLRNVFGKSSNSEQEGTYCPTYEEVKDQITSPPGYVRGTNLIKKLNQLVESKGGFFKMNYEFAKSTSNSDNLYQRIHNAPEIINVKAANLKEKQLIKCKWCKCINKLSDSSFWYKHKLEYHAAKHKKDSSKYFYSDMSTSKNDFDNIKLGDYINNYVTPVSSWLSKDLEHCKTAEDMRDVIDNLQHTGPSYDDEDSDYEEEDPNPQFTAMLNQYRNSYQEDSKISQNQTMDNLVNVITSDNHSEKYEAGCDNPWQAYTAYGIPLYNDQDTINAFRGNHKHSFAAYNNVGINNSNTHEQHMINPFNAIYGFGDYNNPKIESFHTTESINATDHYAYKESSQNMESYSNELWLSKLQFGHQQPNQPSGYCEPIGNSQLRHTTCEEKEPANNFNFSEFLQTNQWADLAQTNPIPNIEGMSQWFYEEDAPDETRFEMLDSEGEKEDKTSFEDYLLELKELEVNSYTHRCGFCFGDLMCEVEYDKSHDPAQEEYVYDCNHYLAGRLDDMLKMHFVDMYDDIGKETKAKVDEHDKKLTSQFITHSVKYTCKVGVDLATSDQAVLASLYNGIEMVRTTTLISTCPLFLTEVILAGFRVRAKYPREIKVTINGDLTGSMEGYHTNYDWKTPSRPMSLEEKGQIEIIMPAGLNCSLSELISKLKTQPVVYIIAPKIDKNNHTLSDGQGIVHYGPDGITRIFPMGSRLPIECNSFTYEAITNYNIILDGEKLYSMDLIHGGLNVNTYCLSGPFDIEVKYWKRSVITSLPSKIMMCLPNINTCFGGWDLFNYRTEFIEFNPGLFHHLCLRNFTGKLTHKCMRENAVAYAMTRFTIHNREVRGTRVDPDIIDSHVVLARITMMTNRANIQINNHHQKILGMMGPLAGLYNIGQRTLTNSIVTTVIDWVAHALDMKEDELKSFAKSMFNTDFIDNMLKLNIWDDLLNIANDYKVEDAKVLNTMILDGPEIRDKYCMHHTSNCSHLSEGANQECECCGRSVIDGTNFCPCCTPRRDVVDEEVMYYKSKIDVYEPLHITGKIEKLDENLEELIKLAQDMQWKNLEDLKTSNKFVGQVRKPKQPDASKLPNDSANIPVERGFALGQPVGLKYNLSSSVEFPKLDPRRIINKMKKPKPFKRNSEITAPHVADPKPKPITEDAAEVGTEAIKEPETRPITEPNSNKIIDDEGFILKPSKDGKSTIRVALMHTTSKAKYRWNELIAEVSAELGPSFILHLINPMTFENNLNVDMPDYRYVKPHMPPGVSFVRMSDYEVVNESNKPNTSRLSCGYDAFCEATNLNISLGDFTTAINSDENFADDELMKVAELYGVNLIVLTPNASCVGHFDLDNDIYGVIVHCTYRDETYNHWAAATIRMIKLEKKYYIASFPSDTAIRSQVVKERGFSDTEIVNLETMDYRDIIQCEITINNILSTEQKAIRMRWPVLTEIKKDGNIVSTFSNNATGLHNPEKSYINVNIPHDILMPIRWLDNDPKGVMETEYFKEHYNRTIGIPTNPRNEIVEVIKECCRTIVRSSAYTSKKSLKNDCSYTGPCTLIPARAISRLERSTIKADLKLKTFDKVYIEINEQLKQVCVASVTKASIYLDFEVSIATQINLFVLKQSTGSQLLKITTLANCFITRTQLESALNNMTCHMGPGGMGKTTQIARLAKPGDLVVAQTNNAVNELRNRCMKGVNVSSLEKASKMTTPINANLFIDECTLIDYIDTCPLIIRNPTSISLYGAANQISKRDMTPTPGVRVETNIVQYVKAENLTTTHQTWRIGEPAATMLQDLEPGLVGNPNKVTTLDIINLETEDWTGLMNIIIDTKPNAIITPYRSCKKQIISVIERRNQIKPDRLLSDIQVVTTHSIQGSEFDRIIVVLRSEKGTWGLNGDPQYLNSACFRGKDVIKVVTIGYNLRPKRLSHILSQQAGNHDPDKYLEVKLADMHNLTRADVDLINQHKLSKKGVSMRYSKVEDGTKLILEKMGIKIAEVINLNGNIEVTQASDAIKSRIMSAVNEVIKIDRELSGSTYVDFSIRAVGKIRTMTYIVDCVVSKPHEFVLPLFGENIKFTKGEGCPLYSSLFIQGKTWTIKIDSQATKLYCRRVLLIGTPSKPCETILNWLGLDTAMNYAEELEVETGTWLDNVCVNTDVTLHLAEERMGRTFEALANTIFSTNPCSQMTKQNKVWLSGRVKKLNIPNASPETWNSVINHHLIITMSKTWIRGRKTYNVYGTAGEIFVFEPEHSGKDLGFKMLELTQILVNPKLAGNPNEEVDIEGMIIPLSNHIKRNTVVAEMLKEQAFNTKLKEADIARDMLWLQSSSKEKTKSYYTTHYPTLPVNVTNNPVTTSPIEDFLENLMVSAAARGNQNRITFYGGCYPHVMYTQGKFYCITIKPSSSNPMVARWYEGMTYTMTLVDKYFEKKRKIEYRPWIINEETIDRGRVLYGLELVTLTNDHLETLFNRGVEELLGWIPLWPNQPNEYYRYSSGTRTLAIDGSQYARPVNNKLVSAAQSGIPMKCYKHETNFIKTTVLHQSMGFALVSMKTFVPQTMFYTQITNDFYSPNYRRVRMPRLCLTPEQIITEKQLVSIQELTIDYKMYKMFRYRLMTGKDDLDSALSFARTQTSTYTMTNIAVYHDSTLKVLLSSNTMKVALFMHHRMSDKYRLLRKIMDLNGNATYMTNFVQTLGSGFFKLLEITGTHLSNILNHVKVSELINRRQLPFTLSNFEELIKEMQVVLQPTNNTVTCTVLRHPDKPNNQPPIRRDPPDEPKYDDDSEDDNDIDEDGKITPTECSEYPPEDPKNQAKDDTGKPSYETGDLDMYRQASQDNNINKIERATKPSTTDQYNNMLQTQQTKSEECEDEDFPCEVKDLNSQYQELKGELYFPTISELTKHVNNTGAKIERKKKPQLTKLKSNNQFVRTGYYCDKQCNDDNPHVFMYWDGKPNKVVDLCRESWENKRHKVHYIIPSELKHWITTTPKTKNKIMPQHMADWIRVNLLSQYGGIWSDASIYCTTNVNSEWELMIKEKKCIMMSGYLNNGVIIPENSLIFSTAGNPIIESLEQLIFNTLDQHLTYNGVIQYMNTKFDPKMVTSVINSLPSNAVDYLMLFVLISLIRKDQEIDCKIVDRMEATFKHTLLDNGCEYVVNKLARQTISSLKPCKLVKITGDVRKRLCEVIPDESSFWWYAKHHSVPWHCPAPWPMLLEGEEEAIDNSETKTWFYGGENKVLLITIGSTGDIKPMMSLYDLFHDLGYNPVIITHYDHHNMIRPRRMYQLRSSYRKCTDKAVSSLSGTTLGSISRGLSYYNELIEDIGNVLKLTIEGVVLTIGSHMTPLVECLAKRTNSTLIWTLPFPWMPISHNGVDLLGDLPISIAAIGHVLKETTLKMLADTWLNKHNVGHLRTKDTRMSPEALTMYTYTEEMIHPSIKLNKSNNWVCVGPTNMTNSIMRLPIDITRSITRQKPNVLITFGSLLNGDTMPTFSNIVIACKKIGMETFVILGDNINIIELEDVIYPIPYHGKGIHLIRSFQYDNSLKLFDLVISHGGSGTSHDIVRNKVPSVIIPIFGDQRLWAASLQEYGVSVTEIMNDTVDHYIERLMDVTQNLPIMKSAYNKMNFNVDYNINPFMEKLNSILGLKEYKTLKELKPMEIDFTLQILDLTYWVEITDNNDSMVKADISDVTLFEEEDVDNWKQCAFKAMKQFLGSNLGKKLEETKLPQLMDLMKETVEPAQLVNIVTSMGLNLLIGCVDTATLYKTNGSNKYVSLMITGTGTMQHVRAIKTITVMNYRPQTVIYNTLIRDYLIDLDLAQFDWLTNYGRKNTEILKNVALLMKCMDEVKTANLMARLTQGNIRLINERSNIHSEWLITHNRKEGYAVCHASINSRDRIIIVAILTGIVSGRVITKPSTVVHVDDIYIILDPIEECIGCVMTKIGITLERSTLKLTNPTNKLQVLAIDAATMKVVNLHNLGVRTNKILQDDSKHYQLLLYNYDNRPHHNLRTKEKFLEATKLIWLGEQPNVDTMQELNETYGAAINRKFYIAGKFKYCIEVPTSTTVMWMLIALTRIGVAAKAKSTTIIYEDKLGDKELDWFYTIFKTSRNQLVPIKMHEVPLTEKYQLSIAHASLVANYGEKFLCYIEQGIITMENDYTIIKKIDRCNDEDVIDDTLRVVPFTISDKKGLYFVDWDLAITNKIVGGAPKWAVMPKVPIPQGELPIIEQVSEPVTWMSKNLIDLIEGGKDRTTTAGDPFQLKINSDGESKSANVTDEDSWDKLNDGIAFMDYNTEPDIAGMNVVTIANLLPEVEEQPLVLQTYIAPYTDNFTGCDWEVVYDMPDITAMKIWEDTDLTDWLSVYAPINPMLIKSNELPSKVVEVTKTTLNKYPLKSRVVLNKVAFEENRSIAGRLGSVAKVRVVKDTPKPAEVIGDMCLAYFRHDYKTLLNEFRHNPLIYDSKDIEAWIKASSNAPQILKETISLLSEEILTKPINMVNIHIKLESLLKSDPIDHMKKQQARIIVWQRKAVCALYASIFKEAKTRLKSLLKREVVYTDGLRPDEIANLGRGQEGVRVFFENDLTKQDRQTDDPIIDVEMIMYKLLGVHENVIASWHEMHKLWKFKGNFCRGQGYSMRLTGQATTALGNAITNMQVHAKFFKRNKELIKLIVFLGDDMLAMLSGRPDSKNLRNYIAVKFNMQSKESISEHVGSFCNFVAYNMDNDHAEFGPDLVRLAYRYEVTNGAHESTPEKLFARSISYLFLIGGTKDVIEILRLNKLKLEIPMWYSFSHVVKACAIKYDISEEEVRNQYIRLLKMICEQKSFEYKFRHFTSNK